MRNLKHFLQSSILRKIPNALFPPNPSNVVENACLIVRQHQLFQGLRWSLPGLDSCKREVYISWLSLSLEMTKVTIWNVLQRILRGDPPAFRGSFSTEAIWEWRICGNQEYSWVAANYRVVAKKIVSRLKFSLSLSPFFMKNLEQKFHPQYFTTHWIGGYQGSCLQDGGCRTWKETTINMC